jgi:hypothetical protein
MGGKVGTTTGLALLLAAGMAWAGGTPGGEGNRGLSPIIIIREGNRGLSPIITLAQVAVKSSSSQVVKAIGICQIIDNTPGWPAGELRVPNTIEADQSARGYFYRTARIDLSNAKRTVMLIEGPQYGSLKPVEGMVNGYEYIPSSPTFAGKDSVTFLVEIGGYQVKVMYVLHVLTSGVGDRPEDIRAICGPKGEIWKISTSIDLSLPRSLLDQSGLDGSNNRGQTTISMKVGAGETAVDTSIRRAA